MRAMLLVACMLIVSSCQFTKQQKTEKLIKEYMKTHLNDYDSYQVVKTETADTVYKDYLIDDRVGKALFGLLLAQKNLVSLEDSLLTEYLDKPIDLQSDAYIAMSEKRLKNNQEKLYTLTSQIKANKDSYKKTFKGWSVTQSYRAKNGFGALGLHSTIFTIDSAFTKVIDSEEIK
jgi:hypothetical protein